MNGLFAGGFWARHALLGEIRALKRNLERDSYVPQIVGRDPDTANVFGQELDAQEAPERPDVARNRVDCPNIARESQRLKVAEQHPLEPRRSQDEYGC